MRMQIDRRRYTGGISLIEVLIAALILSFGITSIGMMMLATMRNTRSAQYYSRAIMLANDISERMQANVDAADDYVVGFGTFPGSASCIPSIGLPKPLPCSPAELAVSDIAEWKARIAGTSAGLPGGDGQIVKGAGTPPVYTITLRWTEGVLTDPDSPTSTPVTATYSQGLQP